jgi:beta-phosphoglucomutase-like phosphatase (HAD superfamily)
MGVAAGDCVVVEDSLPGIRAGLAAGMTVFAFQPQDLDPRIPAEVTVLKSLLELHGLLGLDASEAAAAEGIR